MSKAILYDATLCVDCKQCEAACAKQNNLPYDDKVAAEPIQSEHKYTVVLNNNDSGAGSLRQTIVAAGSGDTILFTNTVSGTIMLTSGGLAIAKNLTIQGPGANVLTVDANDSSRVFNVSAGTFNVTVAYN